MAAERGSQRLRRASRGRGEAEQEARGSGDERRPDEADSSEEQGKGEDQGRNDSDGTGIFAELKNVASDAALAVLAPVAKQAATKAAKFAVKKGPELMEDKVLPKLAESGGPAALAAGLKEGGGPVGSLLSKVTGGDDDDGDGGGNAGDGTGKGRRMPIQQAVDVAAPIDIVYDQFTQFEDWPKFMHRVERVEQKDDATVAFHEKVWGFRRHWEAEIVEQRPDERIVWESVSGMEHVGAVTFHELSERLTRIELNIDIDPSGPIEKIARGARFAKRAARADLKRFKAYVEMHEDVTGAWRGEIEDGEVVSEDDSEYEDEYAEDDREPEAEYEDEEPQAEYDDEEEPAEEEEEPAEEEQPKKRAPARSRSSSSRSRSSNGSSKSKSAAPKSRSRSRGSSNGSSKSSQAKGSSSRSRSSKGSSSTRKSPAKSGGRSKS
jgi:uncharacterized membrane protein